jgi:hypothetical protein
MPYLREGYKSANNPDEDDVEGHGGHGRNRAVPTEDDTEGHGGHGRNRAVPTEDDTEGHGGHGRNRAVPTEDDDTEGHDFRSPASRGE